MSGAVTRRPHRGRAYARSSELANDHWNKVDEPGGRKLWFRLVFGFTLLALSGTAFIALGAALFEHAWDYHHEGHTALPMVLCVISIVHYTIPANDDTLAQVEIDLPPPPYEADGSLGPPPAVYYVSGDQLVSPPPPPDLMLHPPEYSEENVKPPSYSSVNPLPDVHGVNSASENNLSPNKHC